MSAPLLVLDHLSLDGPAGPVFALDDVTVDRGRLAVLQGPSGSGRSSALLALTGRMRGLRGSGRFARLDLVRDARRVRRRTAVARITGLVDLESRLTVEDSITERALTEGVPATTAEQAVRGVECLLQRPVQRRVLVETLTALERSVLALALGCVRPAELIVLDDVDAGLDRSDLAVLYAALQTVAGTGPAVLVSAVSAAAVPAGTGIITLRPDRDQPRTPAPTTSRPDTTDPTEEN